MKRRKDECLFCFSRRCYERVVSTNDDGARYDEVACFKHVGLLHKHSDVNAEGVIKAFISSTGKLKRGMPFHMGG